MRLTVIVERLWQAQGKSYSPGFNCVLKWGGVGGGGGGGGRGDRYNDIENTIKL